MAILKKIGLGILTLTIAAASLAVMGALLLGILQISGATEGKAPAAADVAILDRYDMYITNQISSALDGVLAIEKVYWLSDDDKVAPEPNQSCYGTADSAAELGWLLEEAQELLAGQDTLFTTDTVTAAGSKISYYLDETILVIVWKQAINDCLYTLSEVKIAHPSQFRRFLSGGSYGSELQLLTTQMASSVNAVLASSGDFYAHRRHGVIVYDGVVQRVHSKFLETCYIDDQGDMLFSYCGELPDEASAQAFVDENNIRFSVAFGPVLVENGVARPVHEYENYLMGSVGGDYSRIALCQRDDLHYFIAIAGQDSSYNCYRLITLAEFQKNIVNFGCKMAYTLDGGQTATMVMNDQLMNRPSYDSERDISDIIYFATAIPNGE
jgi:hypothetical protein